MKPRKLGSHAGRREGSKASINTRQLGNAPARHWFSRCSATDVFERTVDRSGGIENWNWLSPPRLRNGIACSLESIEVLERRCSLGGESVDLCAQVIGDELDALSNGVLEGECAVLDPSCPGASGRLSCNHGVTNVPAIVPMARDRPERSPRGSTGAERPCAPRIVTRGHAFRNSKADALSS